MVTEGQTTKNVVFILKGAFNGIFLDCIKQLSKITQKLNKKEMFLL